MELKDSNLIFAFWIIYIVSPNCLKATGDFHINLRSEGLLFVWSFENENAKIILTKL